MFRFLGSILVVLMALALTLAVAALLLGGLVKRMVPDRPVRLTVFDGIAPEGRARPRLRAALQEADTGVYLRQRPLVVRIPDRWTGRAYTTRDGLYVARGPADLPPGAHAYTVGYAGTHPRLDILSRGTIWVRPADTPVVWFDAAAIVPTGPSAKTGEAAPADVRDAVKTLASGRQAVYLVTADAPEYALVRRRLEGFGVPPGPAFRVIPGRERQRLAGLRGVWPSVVLAVAASPAIEQAARAAGVPGRLVPPADGSVEAAGIVEAWRGVLEGMTGDRDRDAAKGR